MDEVHQEKEKQRQFEAEPEIASLGRDEGPRFPKADYFDALKGEENGHLGVGDGVEKGERDHHHEFLVVRQKVIVVGSKPVRRTPIFVELHRARLTSYSSYLTLRRKLPYRRT